jgi:predicted ATPase
VKLIGRDHELGVVRLHLRARKNLAVFGAAGVGKTALVTEAIAGAAEVVYCADTSTLKTACESLLGQFGESVNEADNVARKRAVLNATRRRRLTFVFDHVGWVGPKLLSLLALLRESHPMIVVARDLSPAATGHLKMILWEFDKLEMKPLDHAAALRLLRVQMKQLGLTVPDARQFEHDALRLAAGNPRHIIEMCQQAGKGRYVFGRRVSTQLMELDRRIHQLDSP